MEPIASASNFTQPSPPSGQTGQRDAAASALSSDFETFLLMLTTQMENQDPLNPIESQDFAVQLATFSGVEQQVRTNALLENLAGGMGLTSLSQLAGWVGMEARVVAPVAFEGAPVELAPEPAPGSDGAELIVYDAFGRQVSRETVPLGQGTIAWAGVDENGQPLEPGQYSFELASISQGEVTSVQPVAHYTRIGEARQGLNGIELVVAGGVVVPSDSVTALREPQVTGL
ncbi:MAG: flagellar hook assembly protein FlgD [Silicimonas sp.]|nr:flagellar hook assembly protein FlgD [Silicimonas sp.]